MYDDDDDDEIVIAAKSATARRNSNSKQNSVLFCGDTVVLKRLCLCYVFLCLSLSRF